MKIFRRSGNHLGDSLCVLLNGRSPLSESHINLRTLEYKQYLLLLESAGKTEEKGWNEEKKRRRNLKKNLCSDFREKKRSKLCGFWKGRRVTTLGKWWKHQTRHKDKNIWEKGVILVEGCLQLFFDKKWLFFIGLCVENHGQCGWKLKCDVEGKFYILLVWGTAGRTCPSYPATFVKDFWISTFPLQPRLHIWSP